jgi:OOP family OmpA-OmpF porin
MFGKIAGIAACLIAVITQVGAQGLSIGLDGGLQGMQYRLPDGADKLLPGGSLDLLYTFRLKGPWNLITGLTAGVYRTRATLPDGFAFNNYQVDDEGSAFQYSMKTEGYKETQRFFAAGIPLLLQYHSAGARMQWYVNGGGKILLPSTANIAISARQLTLSGYYPDYNIYVSNLPQHGFGVLNNWKTSATADLKPSAVLSAATGLSFPLGNGMRLYTGLYVDYGLTTLKGRNDSLPLVTYSPAGISGIKESSVLNMSNTGQATLFAIGLQVRISLEKVRSKPSVRPAPSAPRAKKPELPAPVDSTISDDDTAFIQKPVIFGAMDETAIPEIDQEHLDDVADILKQHPKIRISLVGHICNSETEKEDPRIGLTRAKAVAAYLQAKGIDRKRMDISSVNISDPVEPNHPAANYQKRCVVIKME